MSEPVRPTNVRWLGGKALTACGLCCLLAALSVATPTAAEGLRDPMQPPASALRGDDGKSPELPRLRMVVVRDGRAHALIDGTLRVQGERFDGWRVARIEPGAVLLDGDDGRHLRITLLGEGGQGIKTESKP